MNMSEQISTVLSRILIAILYEGVKVRHDILTVQSGDPVMHAIKNPE